MQEQIRFTYSRGSSSGWFSKNAWTMSPGSIARTIFFVVSVTTTFPVLISVTSPITRRVGIPPVSTKMVLYVKTMNFSFLLMKILGKETL